MKKIFFLFAVFCLTQAGTVQADTDLTAYSNVIYVAPATVAPSVDGNETTLSICMCTGRVVRVCGSRVRNPFPVGPYRQGVVQSDRSDDPDV